MREALSYSHARHIGQVLTVDLATQIVAETAERTARYHQMIVATLLPSKPTLQQIVRLEELILHGEQVETPTRHYFAPGLYAREMFIPAGTVLTGAVHRTEHLALFVGDITVWTEGGMTRLTGHHTFVSKPGAKRVGYAHADTWCTGFFPTDKTDVAELERDLVEDAHRLQCNRLRFNPQILIELES